jgi:hypothetical protein
MHSLTEDFSKQIFECGDQITLLRVGHLFEYKRDEFRFCKRGVVLA